MSEVEDDKEFQGKSEEWKHAMHVAGREFVLTFVFMALLISAFIAGIHNGPEDPDVIDWRGLIILLCILSLAFICARHQARYQFKKTYEKCKSKNTKD